MPNVWTHILFGEEAITEAGIWNAVKSHLPYFRLGAQGPDPFFYHNFWPWKETPVQEVGEVLHKTKCGPFLIDMIEYGKTDDPRIQSYILGFVTHHILDRNTHPYIHYRAGLEGNKHQRLEIIIDTLLMKEHKDVDTWKTPVYKEIDVGPTLYKPIESMLSELIQRFYPDTAERMPDDYVDQSYHDMVLALKLLFDPYGWKNKVLRKQVSSFSYRREIGNEDYLNEEGNVWLHPSVKEEQSNATFEELLKQASDEATTILPLIYDYWHNEENCVRDLKDQIGNRSYDTGKDCNLPLPLKHFSPIV
ncbi:zinc dependent phospholipase C family protein [Guptibacillus algicola]|uniref:zinc dependent phospholipase C family protein n=1 Tax=Guptibacillus algicola TaxID=225844 RepID=UPI001CD6E528|nr:zinc dependent phospholipase C family protein [Alkalihalobacillus algicola]MCA0988852.1 zinc dependent phospholipase C family protein [Alkalihalobacillus algicola]